MTVFAQPTCNTGDLRSTSIIRSTKELYWSAYALQPPSPLDIDVGRPGGAPKEIFTRLGYSRGMAGLLPAERIEQSIFRLRSQNVMLDEDLAELYEVPTKRLNEQVRRNRGRFPRDFMFQLTAVEAEALRSQIATLEVTRGRHRKYLPYAFTEQGVAMLSGVLRSRRAVQVNIEIMRTFVRLRRILTEHKNLARKLDTLERKYDVQFKVVFDAIRKLMEPPLAHSRSRIGFRT